MYPGFIKYYIIFLFNIYIGLKLLNKKPNSCAQNIFIFVFAFILSVLTFITFTNNTTNSYLISLLTLWIFMGVYTARPQISFVITVLSFGMSFCAHCFAALISTIIVYIFTTNKNAISYLAISLLSTICHTLVCIILLRIKRFKNGLPLTHLTSFVNGATILCSLFVFLPIYFPANNDIFVHRLFALIITITSLSFLIFWWQAQITKEYHRQLELRAAESLRAENMRLLLENRKLTADKDRMAFITHRDNTLITTLSNATLNYLYTDFSDSEEACKVRDELAANIRALSAGRTSLPNNYNQKEARDFDTNFSLLNKLLHQMDADAIQMNITFSVHFGVMLDEFVPKDISEIDLVHMVDDLLKNAFKATRNSEPRMVQLQFYRLGKHFVVEVADNGIPFEVRSLVNMGIEKLTTYEDGSGIGLVDIWSAKEKYGATYHLEEYMTPGPFSKKISLTFDKKNRYSIRTWRKDEILQMSRRADLQVYEHIE